jgi:DNA-binding YbaB/EbfC family protein
MQEALERQSVTGSAGGGMVTVEADGKGTVRKIKLDPSVVNPSDVEMLEDLIVVAVADAQKKAAEVQQSEMGRITGGMDLPFKLPF